MDKNMWHTPGGTVRNVYLDILRQPHTLIAGTTGSGKSVAINGIIRTALHKAPPEAQFIFIDPKRVELRMYKDLPHTLYYCNTAAESLGILKTMTKTMMYRYAEIEQRGLKQSDSTHIYIFIDELSDIIRKEPSVVKVLAEIAQLGRAANIHLIAATQNPNRKTLSAEFAGNCPARLALRCENQIESRQIINCDVAVTLPQYGQAYYKSPSPDYFIPHLVGIPCYTDEDLAAHVKWWIDQK